MPSRLAFNLAFKRVQGVYPSVYSESSFPSHPPDHIKKPLRHSKKAGVGQFDTAVSAVRELREILPIIPPFYDSSILKVTAVQTSGTRATTTSDCFLLRCSYARGSGGGDPLIAQWRAQMRRRGYNRVRQKRAVTE